MKTTKIIFILLVLAATVCTSASAKDVSFRRQQIETNYAARFRQLYAKAEYEASRLDVTERLLWIEFVTGADTPYSDKFSLHTVGGGRGSLNFTTSTAIDEEIVTSSSLAASLSIADATKLTTLTRPQRYLEAHLADSFSLSEFAIFLLSEDSLSVFSRIADSRFQNRRLRFQARNLLQTAERLQDEALQIEAERNAALVAMKYEEQRQAEQVSAPAEREQPKPVAAGVVTAISYSPGSSICMVEGVDQILSQGDVIEADDIKGVRVESISRNSVRFSKKSKVWDQKLGDEPGSLMID